MVTLAALGLAAFLIRAWGLTRQSLWIDEVMSLKFAGFDDSMTWTRLRLNLQGPLHSLVLYLWASLFGWGETSIRLPQAIVSAATVPALFLVARKDFGHRTAMAGAIALAINPFHVWYAQEVRNYAFLVLFALLSTAAIRRLEEREGPGAIAGVIASWAGGLLCNMSFAFHAVAAGIYALGRVRVERRLLIGLAISGAMTAVILLPWEIEFFERRVQNSYLLKLESVPEEMKLRGETTAPVSGIPFALYAFSVGYSFGPSLRDLHEGAPIDAITRHAPAVALAALSFGILGGAGLIRWLRGDRRRRFWLLSLIVPMLLAYFAASRNLKVFNPRYASVGLPAFAMLLADGADFVRPRWLRIAAICGVAAISVVSLIQLQTRPAYWKEDARQATRILRAEMQPGDLVFVVGTLDPIYRYYWTGLRGNPEYKRFVADRELNPDNPTDGKKALDTIRSARTTYVVFYRDAYDDPAGKWAALLKSHFPVAESWTPVGMKIWRLGPEVAS
jgi:hypothetical protein